MSAKGFCGFSDKTLAAVVRGFKLKFHWDQFPRNFLADLLATSPTSP